MRMLVMFDLPTGSKAERRAYAQFRKFLIEDGFTMSQYSVYTRVVLSRESTEAHLRRLRANIPPVGAVTVITLTEKQYENREVLVDTRLPEKTEELGVQLTLVF